MPQLKGVIFDWAGTTVDYGSFAPVQAFLDTFGEVGIEVKPGEVRRFMGMKKKEHLAALCSLPNIAARWEERFGEESGAGDLDRLYESFERHLFETLCDFARPIGGVVELVERLRRKGMKIGSTTGYTRGMMEVILPKAAEQGYAPDCLVTADEVKGGRPKPWMIWANAEKLDLYPAAQVVKVGDTEADMQEGVNAGTWVIGVLEGGNEVGLTEAEAETLGESELERIKSAAANRLKSAGAHFVLDRIELLDPALEEIDSLLEHGICPCCRYGEGRRILG